jgi:hypothetical protein
MSCLILKINKMTKRTLFMLFISVSLFGFIGCHHDAKPLSAGETVKPNTGYSVENKSDDGYEPVHNTKLKRPYEKLKPNLNPNVPNQLKPHSRLVMTDVEDRTFFDFFAWQTFVGLVWPADSIYRGVPNRAITPEDFSKYNSNNPKKPNRVPVVWETFRTFDDAFPVTNENPTASPPEEWDATAYERPFVLNLTSKGKGHDNLNEAFSSVLIDQNHQYVRYNLQLNEVMYEFIRENKWYLKENLPKSPTPATLPPLVDPTKQTPITISQPQTNTVIKQTVNGNTIEIKSAWRIMILKEDSAKPWRKIDDLSRYFISTVDIKNPITGETENDVKVGLVGLHVVVKTPQFVQGLWSSFEHVDNIKTPEGSGIRPSFHGVKDTIYEQGFSYQPSNTLVKKEKDRMPVGVSRVYKIPETPVGTGLHLPDGLSTVALNTAFQRLLKGTVWANYQLVITQWPTDPTTFYPKPDLFPRSAYPSGDPKKDSLALPAVKEAYNRAKESAKNAYPRWSGLPLPQIGALNTTMETYFQNPNPPTKGSNKGIRQPIENTSCMGCHYGASDTDYSWGLKKRTFPQPFNQGRISPNDSTLVNYINSIK